MAGLAIRFTFVQRRLSITGVKDGICEMDCACVIGGKDELKGIQNGN